MIRWLRVALAALCLSGLGVALARDGQLAQAELARKERHRQALMAQAVLVEELVRVGGGGRLALAPAGGGYALLDAEGGAVAPWSAVAGRVQARTRVALRLDGHQPSDLPLAMGGLVSGPTVWASTPGVYQGPGWNIRMVLLLTGGALAAGVLAVDLAVVFGARRRERTRDEARRQLLQRVSHELRTPAAGVKSLVETLEAGAAEDPAAVRAFLPVIREEADRLAEGIDRLLRAARGGGLERTPLELSGWAAAVARRWERRLPALEVEAPGPLPFLADPRRLDEAVDALLDNARRYGAAPVRLSVRLEGGAARISVSDAGAGVAPEDRRRIFERGGRAGADEGRAMGGFGLGLWAAGEVARAHGGSIALEGKNRFVLLLRGP